MSLILLQRATRVEDSFIYSAETPVFRLISNPLRNYSVTLMRRQYSPFILNGLAKSYAHLFNSFLPVFTVPYFISYFLVILCLL